MGGTCGFTHRIRYEFFRIRAAIRARRFPESVDQEIATRALQAIDEDPLDPDQAHPLELLGAAVDPGAGPVQIPGHGLLRELDASIYERLRRHGCVNHLGAYRQSRIMDDPCRYYTPTCGPDRSIRAWLSHSDPLRRNYMN
jgi:hypothetical protein